MIFHFSFKETNYRCCQKRSYFLLSVKKTENFSFSSLIALLLALVVTIMVFDTYLETSLTVLTSSNTCFISLRKLCVPSLSCNLESSTWFSTEATSSKLSESSSVFIQHNLIFVTWKQNSCVVQNYYLILETLRFRWTFAVSVFVFSLDGGFSSFFIGSFIDS